LDSMPRESNHCLIVSWSPRVSWATCWNERQEGT
jgi:hypothetical protein